MPSIADLSTTIDQINTEQQQNLGGAPLTYRIYSIKKAAGGTRDIAEPSPALKNIQKRLARALTLVGAGGFAFAYEKGCSPVKNALYHRRGKYMLHADIKNFFPSIGKRAVRACIQTLYGVDDRRFEIFWNLVSFNGGLPIGAPTSPLLANRVMIGADRRLKRLKLFVRYSRYADDMIFSSRRPFKEDFAKKVESALREEGFRLNGKKTYFMHGRREVTGIIVCDNGRLSTGTSFKKRLKKEIYAYLVKNEGRANRLYGKLAHLKSVEPAYLRVIVKKYLPLDQRGFFGPIVRNKKWKG